MDAEEKWKLISRGLQEVVGAERLQETLKSRDLKIYWGTAPTGKPHLGYFVPMLKIADFLAAGCEVIVLFANMHAYLDNMKSSWGLLEKRTAYYILVIKAMLRQVGVPLEKLRFVTGTDFQLKPEYSLDVYRLSAAVSTKDTQHAGAEVVKQVKVPKMSGLLYPILQALDEIHLGVDAQFGGVDQRKIFMFARDFLPRIGLNSASHLMNPLVPGLGKGGKMSASDPSSKIDFTDTAAEIRKKISKTFCADGVAEGNALLAVLKYVIWRLPAFDKEGKQFVVDRSEEYGGRLSFSTYDEVESAFKKQELASADLKSGLAVEVEKLIAPMRTFLEDPENRMAFVEAYPPEPVFVKEKKPKGGKKRTESPTSPPPETN